MRRSISVFDTSRREQRKTALATASWMRSRATQSRFGQPSQTGEAYSRAGRTRPTNRRLTIAAEFRRWASRLSTKTWKLCFRISDWTWSVHFRLDVSTTPRWRVRSVKGISTAPRVNIGDVPGFGWRRLKNMCIDLLALNVVSHWLAQLLMRSRSSEMRQLHWFGLLRQRSYSWVSSANIAVLEDVTDGRSR